MRSLLLALLFLPVLVNAQSIAQKADELLSAYSDQQKFSGNVLIAKHGKILFQKAYGYADRKTKRANTLETEFRVGSLTKMFTSTLILQLVASSQLSLSDPLSKFVHGFPNGDQVQIVHLLSHTSGIKGITESPAPVTIEESIARFKSGALAFQPGSRFEYNNFNFILLSFIAQKVSGKPFHQLLEQRVLNKAGMTHSGLDTDDRVSAAKALGYVTNPETVQWQEAESGNVAVASGAGALYSTINDLYKWSLAIQSGSVLPGSMLTRAQQPVQNNYGLGWMISEDNGRMQTGHTGSIPGFIANYMQFPKEEVTIILLSNYQDVDGRRLSNDLKALVFGEPYQLPVQKKAVILSPDVLSRYTGEYQLANGFGISISREGSKLYALAQGDPQKIELTPESEKKFYLKGPETEIEFIEEGKAVKYMFVNLQGGQKFTKTK